MDRAGDADRRSPRLAIGEWRKQVTEETNELSLYGNSLYRCKGNGFLKLLGDIYYEHAGIVQVGNTKYRPTRSGYLILDPGIRQYGPAALRGYQSRVITWYIFENIIYRKTKTLEVTVEEDLVLTRSPNHLYPTYLLKQDNPDEYNEEDEKEGDEAEEEEELGEGKEAEDKEEEVEEGDKDTNEDYEERDEEDK